jgi:hypothetical protein
MQHERILAGFGNAVWRNTVLAGLAIVAFYKYAPEPSENVYLTRWIAMYSRSREDWLNFNAVHTAASQESADQALLFHDAKAPVLRRYRYPQCVQKKTFMRNCMFTDEWLQGNWTRFSVPEWRWNGGGSE